MPIYQSELTPITVNAEAAAHLLGISRSSIFGLLAKKAIPSTVIAGRRVIKYNDLLSFADRQSAGPDPKAQMRIARAQRAVASKRRPSPVGKATSSEQPS